jgi:hypothetical protein
VISTAGVLSGTLSEGVLSTGRLSVGVISTAGVLLSRYGSEVLSRLQETNEKTSIKTAIDNTKYFFDDFILLSP